MTEPQRTEGEVDAEQGVDPFKTNPAFVEQIDWAARWTERHPDVAPKE